MSLHIYDVYLQKKIHSTTNNRRNMDKRELMTRAIRLAEESVKLGGGPFGAVIARDGKIVAEASNRVTLDCDPTAHAEVSAIRKAAKVLGTFDLNGCEIFTSCEPCPMCLGAIYWANLDKIYFANNRKDAAKSKHLPLRRLRNVFIKKFFHKFSSLKIGTTISEFEALSQAM